METRSNKQEGNEMTDQKKLREDTAYMKQVAHRLTGIPVDRIMVINYSIDKDGLFSGTVEIDGYREHVHEYHS